MMNRDMVDNMEQALLEFAKMTESVTKPLMKSMEMFIKSDAYNSLLDLLSSIPEDIQNTELFSRINALRNAEITFNDVVWIQNNIGYKTYEESIRVLHDKHSPSALDKYVLSIIESDKMSRREKLIILLAHFEMLIYQTKPYERKAWDKLKRKVGDEIETVHDVVRENFAKLFVAGIVFIVYSNADSYKNGIDRRIPFRNNILHKGVIDYTEEEINVAYETLVYFISELTLMEVA